ncbi:protein lingerer isoform X2 [Cimex lectularius]|uniref:Protein lingerer n=1 Tax=Cimex lectularius TaxID=79782 RepID=A0A8I6RCW0_CIMLE|nr:protein lingerer isoform X2 [Cimex lectularius]
MNQSTNKVRKGRMPEVNKDNNQKVVRTNDIKVDNAKQTDKSQAVPTPEQMRIAQIIDMRSEDPSLKDKLKQVMDATQTTVDEAYTALHDSDNDINKAVNLLLEGGMKDEWSTSSKKKKVRTVSEKSKDPNQQSPTTTENSNQNQNDEEDLGNGITQSTFSKSENRGRGGGRPYNKSRGGRGGQTNMNNANSLNEKVDKTNVQRGGRNQTNGPSNKGNRSFRGGRQGPRGRGRGGGAMFRRPIENWNESNLQNNINNAPPDWDSEEYTGSLANSQVFTASAPPKPKSGDIDLSSLIQRDQIPSDRTTPPAEPITHSFTSSQILSHFAIQQQLSLDNQNVNKGMNREPDMLNEVNSVNAISSSSLPLTSVGRSSGIVPSSIPLALGRSLSVSSNISPLASTSRASSYIGTTTNALPLSAVNRTNLTGTMPQLTKPDVFNVGRGKGGASLMNYRPDDNRLPRMSTKVKPRIPPPSKIPLTAVEMPPDGDSSIGRLDVQFGALDFGESSSDTLPNSPPSPQRSSPSPPPTDAFATQNNTQGNDSLISNDSRSFSPVPGTVSNSLTPQLSDVGSSKIPETTTSSLYQDSVYQSSLYTKSPQQSQGIYNSTYTTGQVFTSSSAIYSSTSTSHSSYSSTVGNYGTNSYPYQYPNYQTSHQVTTQPSTNNHTTYQSTNNLYGIGSHSVYGSSVTSSYTMPYQTTYNSSNQHKAMPSAPSSKEYDSPTPNVNLSSITHTAAISGTSTLLSSTQTTPTSKTTGSTTMSKGTMVTNMPPGVQPLVGTHQYIVGQGTMPYFQQQPALFYEDLQLMPQQRLQNIPGYFEVGYQPSTTREYNLSDGRFARTDTTSPVPSITQQSGSQAHQQQLMNPTAIPPAFAYFYGGSAVVPGNFSFSAPTIYPVAATGSTTGHGSTNSGTYGKGPTTYAGSYTGIYENSQQNVEGYKSNTSQVPKVQPTQSANPSTSSDISNIYSKSHSALSKSYDKPGFHCATPPPFNLGSQNSGLGPGGYPQHIFIPTMTPHHNTPLMHQPLHQEGGNSVSGRSQVNSQQNKQSKNNYSSTYWTQN